MTVEESLCLRVSHAIAAISEPGLGAWDQAWEIVEGPSRRFIDSLLTFTTGGDVARRRVEAAGNDVVRAWKRAKHEWIQRGRPAA